MKKLLFVLPSFLPVSPVKAALGLAKGLREEYRIAMVSVDPYDGNMSSVTDEYEKYGIDYFFLDQKGIRRIIAAVSALSEICDKYEPDLVISYLLRPDLIVSMLKSNAPKVASIRNMIEQEYSLVYGRWLGNVLGYFHRKSLLKFRKIVVMSKDMKNYFIENGFAEENLELIYNFLDENDIEQKLSEKSELPFNCELPVCVTASSIDARKNVGLFVRTAFELMKEGLRFNVLIIGEGKERKSLENTVAGFGELKKYFAFTGQILNPLPYIKRSDYFIMTSKAEGVSRALLEALYLGKFCIVSNIPGNRELINNCENGFLFSDNNSFKDSLRAALGGNMKNNCILDNQYSYGTNVKKYSELFNKLISG